MSRIAQRMVVDCSFFRPSTAFTTVRAQYCSADGSGLLILPLVNGFHHGSSAVLLSGLQWIAHSSARQRLSPRFARRIAQRMALDCSFFHSSTAFTTVRALFCSADDSVLLILPLVNGFHDSLRAVLLSGWHQIAHTSTCQQLSQRFARRIAQRIAVGCSFFRSSTAFTTVRALYCSVEAIVILILPLVNGFPDGLRAVLLFGWQCIARSSARQRLSRQFACRFALGMAADCSCFRSSTAFTVCTPFCSANGSGLLILTLLTAFPKVCAPISLADVGGLLILLLVVSFHDSLCAVFPDGWHYSWFVGSFISSAC